MMLSIFLLVSPIRACPCSEIFVSRSPHLSLVVFSWCWYFPPSILFFAILAFSMLPSVSRCVFGIASLGMCHSLFLFFSCIWPYCVAYGIFFVASPLFISPNLPICIRAPYYHVSFSCLVQDFFNFSPSTHAVFFCMSTARRIGGYDLDGHVRVFRPIATLSTLLLGLSICDIYIAAYFHVSLSMVLLFYSWFFSFGGG